jgi:diacylglycerol kinase family enzyme
VTRDGREGSEPPRAPDVEVSGDDRDLARAIAGAHVPLVCFDPVRSDLARTVGLSRVATGMTAGIDAIRTSSGLAVNAVVFGTPPDRTMLWTRAHALEVTLDDAPWFEGRATGVMVANGQFLRGLDLVPRGHPGDGRLEVQVYAVGRAGRAEMRRRLPSGGHLPHPEIHVRSASRIQLRAARRLRLELDGHRVAGTADVVVEVVPRAFRLLL